MHCIVIPKPFDIYNKQENNKYYTYLLLQYINGTNGMNVSLYLDDMSLNARTT